MKGAWKILLAGAILSAVLIAGGAKGTQGGDIQFGMNGDIVTITGHTNLATGDRLLMNVVSAGFTPTEKGTGGGFSGAAGTVFVQPGSPLNVYTFEVNVSTFPPGEYLVTVESVETGFRDSAQFVLPRTPVPTHAPFTPTPGPATISTPSTPPLTTIAVPAAPSNPAPLAMTTSTVAFLLATGILLLRR